MTLPQPIVTSLIVYALIGVAGVILVSVLGLSGKLSKDDVGHVEIPVVIVTTFSIWLFW